MRAAAVAIEYDPTITREFSEVYSIKVSAYAATKVCLWHVGTNMPTGSATRRTIP